jgi:signal transduction histidine kinase
MLEERCTIDGNVQYGNDIKIIKEEIKRLQDVLAEFLRFAKPIKPEYGLHDLNLIIDEVITFLEPENRKHDIRIVRESIGEIPMIQVDRNSMKQVLYNLIVNASQAMPQGGVITVRTGLLGEEVKIDVIDSGCGIPEENRERIFDLFFTTTKDGLGLGLPIVERIVEDHEGRVTVESEVGRGSTFSVILPRVLADS